MIGHYRVIRPLGAGGMGEVYLAEDSRLDRKVALKFLPKDLEQDPTARKRFAREAKAAAALDHPYICKIYEVGEVEGRSFIAMEYVEGENLRQKLNRGPFGVEEGLRAALEIAEALEAAHEKRIVHRDLKPANIMLTRRGHIKVMDFGLARRVLSPDTTQDETLGTTITDPGVAPGTLAYMSPEQIRGLPVDTRSDIFAFGVVLYEMLTSIDPLKKSTPMDTANAILNETPPPLARYAREVPDLLQHAVGKMLAKEPERRYQSVHEVRTDLRSILEKGPPPTSAAAPRGLSGFWRPVWRTFALLAVIIAVAAATLWVQENLFRSPAEVLAFEERDWILLADFENLTGEDIFDRSLDTALRISMEQSSYVNVVPDRRVREALRRMKREGVETIDEYLAREIAEREGIKAVLLPGISAVGGTYVLSAILQDPVTGRSVESAMIRTRAREDVLEALDELASRIRRDLGESVAAITRQSKPLAEVTTPSLEALKQYSLGIQSHWESRFEEAKAFYESALQEDPGFTAAMASLGMIHYERFDRDEGRSLLSKAMEHVQDLTDKERYGIMAFHARAVENDIEKAAQYLKALSAMYPDDGATRNNLGWFYFQMGRYEEALAEYQEAIRIDPTFMITYDGINRILLYHLGDLDSAVELSRRQLAQNDGYPWGYDSLGWALVGKGELEQAQAAFEKAVEISPSRTEFIYRLGHVLRLRGDYSAAREAFERVMEVNPEAYPAHYLIGVVSRRLGDESEAVRHFEAFRAEIEREMKGNPVNAYNYVQLGLVLARLGRLEGALQSGRRALELDPEEHFGQAQLFSVAGKTDDALQQLETAIEKGWSNYVWMKIHADLENLRNEPRFQALLKRHLKGTETGPGFVRQSEKP